MEEISPAATDVEDKETYEMILAKQAADENAVDADGKLIGEEESKEVLEASAGTIGDCHGRFKGPGVSDQSFLYH